MKPYEAPQITVTEFEPVGVVCYSGGIDTPIITFHKKKSINPFNTI